MADPANQKPIAGLDTEEEKKKLEVDKLRIEVQRLRRPLRTALLEFTWKDLAAICVAVLGISLAWWTGLFNSRQEHLAATNERMQIERTRLELGNVELAKTRAGLEADGRRLETQIQTLKDQIRLFEGEREAVKALVAMRTKGPALILFSYGSDAEHFEVTIEPSESWDTAKKPVFDARIGDALDRMRTIPGLSALRIGGIELSGQDVQKIGRLKQLTTLDLYECQLSDQLIEPLSGLTSIKALSIHDKNIRHPKALRSLQTLTTLVLSGTSLDDDGLSLLTALRDSLRKLLIDDTNVSDNGVKHLNEFKRLVLLSVMGTKLTPVGYSQLDMYGLVSLVVNRGVISEASQEILMKKMPRLLVNDTLDPRNDPLPALKPPKRIWYQRSY